MVKLMKIKFIFLAILVFVLVGCSYNKDIDINKNLENPTCFLIRSDHSVLEVKSGESLSNILFEGSTCSQETLFENNKNQIKTGYLKEEDVPIGNSTIEAFAQLNEYRRIAFALVWKNSDGNRKCFCKDSIMMQSKNIEQECEFLKDHLKNNSLFDICLS